MSTTRLAGLLSLLLVTQHSLADEKHLEHAAVMKAVDSTKMKTVSVVPAAGWRPGHPRKS
jgi:hypothetical protein